MIFIKRFKPKGQKQNKITVRNTKKIIKAPMITIDNSDVSNVLNFAIIFFILLI